MADTDLLVLAAMLLPEVTGAGPLLSSDIHSSLFAAARSSLRQPDGLAHRAADLAEAYLTEYLAAVGEVPRSAPVSRVLHGWLLNQTVSGAVRTLCQAAQFRQRDGDGPRLAKVERR